MHKLDISICPTALEFPSGDRYDEYRLLAAIKRYAQETLGDVEFVTLQVGHRQGHCWERLDGCDDKGAEFVADFFSAHGADDDLYTERSSDE